MLVAFTPRPQRERCHSERCEALCTPPSCFRKGLALAWNRTRNGLGAGAAVVDPTPCTFRRKRGTDRHHLPGRHPEPRLPHGSHGQTRPGPGRQVECTPKPGKKKAPVPAPNGGETGQAMGFSTTVPDAAPEGMGRTAPHARDTCQPPNRAPPGTREALIGRRGSPVASVALGRVIGQWGHRARHRGGATPWPPCHSTSPGTRCAHCLGGREQTSFPTVAPYSVHLAGAA
jgi:hypothetical protein